MPSCTRINMQYYKEQLTTDEMLKLLDDIAYLGLNGTDEISEYQQKIKNELSKYELLEP